MRFFVGSRSWCDCFVVCERGDFVTSLLFILLDEFEKGAPINLGCLKPSGLQTEAREKGEVESEEWLRLGNISNSLNEF